MINVYQNLGNVSLVLDTTIELCFDYTNNIYRVRYNDFDLDGDQDIVVWCRNNILFIENLDDLSFGPIQNILNGIDIPALGNLVDIDNDGDLDITAISHGNEILWLENNGMNTFGSSYQIADNLEYPIEIHPADLDMDGNIDLISSSFEGDKLLWHQNQNTVFHSSKFITSEVEEPRGLHAADLDNDGDPDIVSVSVVDNKLAWYENVVCEDLNKFSSLVVGSENAVLQCGDIRVIDMNGKIVWSGKVEQNHHPISLDLPAGMYIIEKESPGSILKRKIIIQ